MMNNQRIFTPPDGYDCIRITGWAKVLVTSSDCSVQRRIERHFTCKHVKSSESLIYIFLVISIDGSSVSCVVSIQPVLGPVYAWHMSDRHPPHCLKEIILLDDTPNRSTIPVD